MLVVFWVGLVVSRLSENDKKVWILFTSIVDGQKLVETMVFSSGPVLKLSGNLLIIDASPNPSLAVGSLEGGIGTA